MALDRYGDVLPRSILKPRSAGDGNPVYVALSFADEHALVTLQEDLRASGIKAEWQDPGLFHCSLLVVEDATDEQLNGLLDGLSLPVRFWVEVASLGTFEADDIPLIANVVANPALIRLQQEFASAALRQGLPVFEFFRATAYKPHITLGYDSDAEIEKLPTLAAIIKLRAEAVLLMRDNYEVVRRILLPETMPDRAFVEAGGPGSGHFGHAGRPGEVGGSLPSGEVAEEARAGPKEVGLQLWNMDWPTWQAYKNSLTDNASVTLAIRLRERQTEDAVVSFVRSHPRTNTPAMAIALGIEPPRVGGAIQRAIEAGRLLAKRLPFSSGASHFWEYTVVERGGPVARHYGPGPHPGTGTDQSVHAGGGAALAEVAGEYRADRQGYDEQQERQRVNYEGPLGKETIGGYLERHDVERSPDGLYHYFHGTPRKGGATANLSAGSYLAADEQEARFFTARDRDLDPQRDVTVFSLWLRPSQIDGGVFATLREGVSLGVVARHYGPGPHPGTGTDQSVHGGGGISGEARLVSGIGPRRAGSRARYKAVIAADGITALAAMTQTQTWRPAWEGLEAIDQVHRMPDYMADLLQRTAKPGQLPFERSRSEIRSGGYWQINGDGAKKIGVDLIEAGYGASQDPDAHPQMTTVHEVGHFLDNVLFGDPQTGGRASMGRGARVGPPGGLPQVVDQEFEDVIVAMRESVDYQTLLGQNLGYFTVEGLSGHFEYPARAAMRVRQPVEMFARGYAQWVALRSGNLMMRAQVDGRNSLADRGGPRLQWDWRNFVPIAGAYDRLFQAAGLLRSVP